MTIDRWTTFQGNSAPRSQVAPGTPCAPCTARGHFCAASEIVDERAVCLHCLDGVPCLRTPRVAAPAKRLSAAECLPDRVEAKRAIAVHEELTRPKLAATAPVAEPVCVVKLRGPMPGSVKVKGGTYKAEQRGRAKVMLTSGMSLRATAAATGLSQGTVMNVRRELPDLPPVKSGRKRKAVQLSAAAAREVVAEAREITAQVANEVRLRGTAFPVPPNVEGTEMGAQSKKIFSTLEKECAVFPAPTDDAQTPGPPYGMPPVQPERTPLAARTGEVLATEYAVVDVSAVPGRKPPSTYDDAIEKLKLLPMGKALMRGFANAAIADTYRNGICKRARQAGMSVISKQDGVVIYLWRRAK